MYIKNNLGLVEGVETMRAQENRMNQISNNLANVDTAGYKKENITFWEMLFTATDERQRVGKAMNIITDQSQGNFENTGNNLDFALGGDGFFKIQTADGVRYTRNGNFTLNAEGQLSTMDGNLVMGNAGAIVLPSSEIAVNKDGTILAEGQVINQFDLARFDDISGLIKEGANRFKTKNEAVQEQELENPLVQQGFLEESNVNVVNEMTAMIDLQRAYQAQQKLIQTIDDLNGQAISRVGKLT